MKQIRFNTFETNSSSAHSLVVGTREDYEAFERGMLEVRPGFSYEFHTLTLRDEKGWEVDENGKEVTYRTFQHKEINEDDVVQIKSPSGDTMIIVSYEYPC